MAPCTTSKNETVCNRPSQKKITSFNKKIPNRVLKQCPVWLLKNKVEE